MLDFRMETFVTVCKYMNYTKAAGALHITQPAVSQHIRHMEEEYGTKLFEFQGKKMFLTQSGRQLLNMATTWKHDDQALRRTFKENATGQHQLIFGVTLTIGEYVIGDYLAEYMKKYPDTQIKLTIANTEGLLKKLDEGAIDFAVVEGYFEKSDYDFQLFRRERYIGVGSPSNSKIHEGNLVYEWSQIFGETLIVREQGSGTREVLERALKEDGRQISDFGNIVEISNMNAIKSIVMGGGGISFLYEAAVQKELKEGTLVELPIQGFPKYHDFTFIWRKNSIFSEQYKELFCQITKAE